MIDHDGYSRGFYRTSKAWYANECKSWYPSNARDTRLSVSFGMYNKEKGTSGDMMMEWIDLGNRLIPRLQVYSDSWSALALFSDLIQELAKVDSRDITEDNFVAILKKCNFEDLTPYERRGKTEDKLK